MNYPPSDPTLNASYYVNSLSIKVLVKVAGSDDVHMGRYYYPTSEWIVIGLDQPCTVVSWCLIPEMTNPEEKRLSQVLYLIGLLTRHYGKELTAELIASIVQKFTTDAADTKLGWAFQ